MADIRAEHSEMRHCSLRALLLKIDGLTFLVFLRLESEHLSTPFGEMSANLRTLGVALFLCSFGDLSRFFKMPRYTTTGCIDTAHCSSIAEGEVIQPEGLQTFAETTLGGLKITSP